MISLFRRSSESRRQRALGRAPEGALAAYLGKPWPDEKARVADVEFLALDFETTGLDPTRDRILAVGFLPVVAGRIVLGEARSMVVAAAGEVGASASVHGITDDVLVAGVPLEDAVSEVLAALAGRVLLAHHVQLERGFLDHACRALWGAGFEAELVDTLALQRGLLSRGFHEEPPPGSLRLWAARERFGLPAYRAHDPLIDALSCAELFLAQVAEMGDASLPLRRVLT
ncbi:MAG TPA: exonuclease domain-containing protein [Phycicoccus sp.]|nr:exonuclease domain-containing protein [Phycicoccus sp.]